MNNFPVKNLGFIPDVRASDFLEGTLPYYIVLPSGDWRLFDPPGEPQYSQVADCAGCVSFSNNNCCEIQLKQQGIEKNFSDRFLAKMSNTQPNGNSFGVVEDAARHFGRVQEEEWPIPTNFTWDSFYIEIPQSIKDKAVFYEESYEYLSFEPESLKYHLKQCPIQIAIPKPHPNHAVCLVHIDENNIAYYFDSYPGSTNYLKTMDANLIESAMKIIIKQKTMIIYKLQGAATLYFPVGAVLVGFASTFAVFQKEFPGAVVIELPPVEFAKFKVSSLVAK